ncbi:hypothetical protein [Chryseobacterium sp. JK1]|uniref:hypothetical protein n=1 Tax=Chryseobacterium sp. JK1 TaxID=874294 RepID=UPI003D69F06F
MIKNIIYILAVLNVFSFANGQIAISKSKINGNSTILDFEDSPFNRKGIILPSVENVSEALATVTSHNNGTFLFDISDDKVKMYENDTWVDLSDSGDDSLIIRNSSPDYSTTQGIIINSHISNAKGVIVLESNNKAMILPKIENPHLNVKSPYPGMMCYDTISNSLAIFNGSEWSYWK